MGLRTVVEDLILTSIFNVPKPRETTQRVIILLYSVLESGNTEKSIVKSYWDQEKVLSKQNE